MKEREEEEGERKEDQIIINKILKIKNHLKKEKR